MILLHNIVEIADGLTTAAPTKFSRSLEILNDLGVDRIPVDVDNPWTRTIWRA